MFRNPSWFTVGDIAQIVGRHVQVWRPGEYTAYAVAGEEGELLRRRLA